MDFLEKDLEDIIWENLQTENGSYNLYCRGFCVDHEKSFYRQVNLGAYGVADIIGFKLLPERGMEGCYIAYIDIYELKKDSISASTFLQANRYAKACLKLVEQYNATLKNKHITAIFDFILVGSKVELSNDFVFLTDTFDNINILTYKINIDGLKFSTHSGYSQKNCGFIPFPKKLKLRKKW